MRKNDPKKYRYYGKYRGKVINNKDPEKRGRIRACVPAVLGQLTSPWATPCLPFAGPKLGFYAIPPKNANVWIEFEDGDPAKPIWSGCFWSKEDLTDLKVTAETTLLKTKTTLIRINDKEKGGSLLIEFNLSKQNGTRIEISNAGIQITCGNRTSIKLDNNQINFNNDTLVVK